MNKNGIYFNVIMWTGVAVLAVWYLTTPSRYDVFSEEQLFDYSYKDMSILVVTPTLTANAYREPGFYNYYNQTCGEECLSVDLDPDIPYNYMSSRNAVELFKRLEANMITDYELSMNVGIVRDYDKIILLHNEYVTKEMFYELTNHPNVIYLYPNALHAEVEITNGTMTLVQGHGYKGRDNGFLWQYDNTRPYEYDVFCAPYDWIEIPNGKQLDCYPERYMLKFPNIIKVVRDI